MTVLVVGAGGLLGSAFVDVFPRDNLGTAGRVDLERITDEMVRGTGVTVVINCAADTDVEGAERDEATSFAANVVLPERLAQVCRRSNAVLVQISSTGCYGVGETRPYNEDDEPQPTTVHHRHKLAGEDHVRASGCDFLILRTGWLFGGRPGQRKNFVWNRMVEASRKDRMISDPYQRGNPTFVGDVARQTKLLLQEGVRGTLNVVSSPVASRLDYVRCIIGSCRLPCEVVAAEAPFQRLARVSPNEAAEPCRLKSLGLEIMPPWPESLARYVTSLTATEAWHSILSESQS